jgi:hypothetical protein
MPHTSSGLFAWSATLKNIESVLKRIAAQNEIIIAQNEKILTLLSAQLVQQLAVPKLQKPKAS